MKFKVGDRVAVYGSSQVGGFESKGRVTGTVAHLHSNGWVQVRLQSDKTELDNYLFHEMQLRKIKKKEPKYYWAYMKSLMSWETDAAILERGQDNMVKVKIVKE